MQAQAKFDSVVTVFFNQGCDTVFCIKKYLDLPAGTNNCLAVGKCYNYSMDDVFEDYLSFGSYNYKSIKTVTDSLNHLGYFAGEDLSGKICYARIPGKITQTTKTKTGTEYTFDMTDYVILKKDTLTNYKYKNEKNC